MADSSQEKEICTVSMKHLVIQNNENFIKNYKKVTRVSQRVIKTPACRVFDLKKDEINIDISEDNNNIYL